jgi:hypothetical protein
MLVTAAVRRRSLASLIRSENDDDPVVVVARLTATTTNDKHPLMGQAPRDGSSNTPNLPRGLGQEEVCRVVCRGGSYVAGAQEAED